MSNPKQVAKGVSEGSFSRSREREKSTPSDDGDSQWIKVCGKGRKKRTAVETEETLDINTVHSENEITTIDCGAVSAMSKDMLPCATQSEESIQVSGNTMGTSN